MSYVIYGIVMAGLTTVYGLHAGVTGLLACLVFRLAIDIDNLRRDFNNNHMNLD
jgi:hypothetical protein